MPESLSPCTTAVRLVQAAGAVLTRRRGNATDDLMLRVAGGLACAGVLGALLVPAIAQLAPFVLYTIWVNGPHSPLLYGGYEPVLLLYGRFFSPVLIGLLGTAASVFVEWINYHLYAKAGDTRAVRRLRESPFVERLTRWYARRPFLVVAFCALGPVPYWIARVLSTLTRYSVPRHLAATAVGRFPRLWLIAWLGQPLAVPTGWLVALAVGSIIVTGSVLIVGRRGRANAPVRPEAVPPIVTAMAHVSPPPGSVLIPGATASR